MAITYDTSSDTDDGSVSSLSWSHNNSGSILLVGVAAVDVSNRTITGITYNSVAMTKIDRNYYNPAYCSDLWYLAGPATGSNTIQVTWNAAVSHGVVGTAISLLGTHATAPLGQKNKTGVSAGLISTALSGIEESSSWLVSHVCTQAGEPFGLDDETVRVVRQRGTGMWGGMNTLVPTSDPDTIGWDIAGQNHLSMVSAEILVAAAASAAVPVGSLSLMGVGR